MSLSSKNANAVGIREILQHGDAMIYPQIVYYHTHLWITVATV